MTELDRFKQAYDNANPQLRDGPSVRTLAQLLELGAKNQRPRARDFAEGKFDALADAEFIAAAIALANATPRSEWPSDAAYALGETVSKKGRAQWRGKIVGWYRTDLTALGYAVESAFEEGSVQIYPETALVPWTPSPCIGACCLDDNDVCIGCRRTIDEIAEAGASTEVTR